MEHALRHLREREQLSGKVGISPVDNQGGIEILRKYANARGALSINNLARAHGWKPKVLSNFYERFKKGRGLAPGWAPLADHFAKNP